MLQHRDKMDHIFPTLVLRNILATGLAAFLLAPLNSEAQCSWGDTSVVPAPEVTFLRTIDDGLDAPTRIATDTNGMIYTTDPGSGRLFKHNSLSRIETVISVAGRPTALAVDPSGNFYVADGDSGSVNVFDPEWNLLYPLGRGRGEFINPNDIAIDPDPAANAVFVSDGGLHQIRVYDLQGLFKYAIGEFGGATGQLDFPSAVHVNAVGEVIVGDQNNDRVQIFDQQGNFLRCFGARYNPSSFNRRFGRITGITTDTLGRIYVADGFQGQIKVFDTNGVALSTIGEFGEAPGQFRTPMGLVVDPFNRLWVASVNNGRTEVIGLDDFTDPHTLNALVWIEPEIFKLPKIAKKLYVFLQVKGVTLSEIDPATVTANGYSTNKGSNKDWKIKDFDKDGLPEFRFMFDARKVLSGVGPGKVVVEISGMLLDGTPFFGQETVTMVSGKGANDHDE